MVNGAIERSKREEKFHEDLINLYTSAVQFCGCHPISISAVVSQGGVAAVKKYLSGHNPRSDLVPLSEYGRLDLSVESLILRDEYRCLFESNEIQEAEKRLNLLKPLVS